MLEEVAIRPDLILIVISRSSTDDKNEISYNPSYAKDLRALCCVLLHLSFISIRFLKIKSSKKFFMIIYASDITLLA